jgi:alkylated DNA repair dioxygenase AlkB
MSASPRTLSLEGELHLPPGFRYAPELLTEVEEQSLVRNLEKLELAPFEFHGFIGKRRVASFGWRYDFNRGGLQKTEDIPTFLDSVRELAAKFSGLPSSKLQQVLVTEYSPGAAIGWHKDRSVFGDVVGLSLVAACPFRFRRKTSNAWDRRSLIVEPRSAYLLQGPSRTEWEHSIPPVDNLRYSITFRTLKRPK